VICQHRLLAVTDDDRVDEVGDRLGVERRVAPAMTIGLAVAAITRVQRDAGEVERGEEVGVAQLGGERHAEQVEVPTAAVPVDGELGHAALPQQRLHVGHTAYVRSARASGRSLRTS
jgi:hypothetical protein